MLQGLLTVAWIFPLCTARHRLRVKGWWSQALLEILGLRLEAAVDHVPPGSMLVANHISWLDIFVINAALPAAFVAKDDVRHWPLVGWLAGANDTVFLRRGSRKHAALINGAIGDILARGHHVAVFPEGTTTDGTQVLHFHGALIQPALTAGRPVVPLAISYWEPDGSRSLAPRYDGDISLGQCLGAILARRRLTARLVALPALGAQGEDRRAVAQAARQAICAGAGLPPPNNRPERPADLPGVPPSDGRPTGSRNPAPGDWVAA